jgi:hypothetical protein
MTLADDNQSVLQARNRPRHVWLIVLAILVIAMAATVGSLIQRARQQSQFLRVIAERGGEVGYSAHTSWDFVFPPVGFVQLAGCRITDADLAPLALLRDIENLSLSRNQITDCGLAHLKPLTKLKQLDLKHNPGITDAGLAHLDGMRNLDLVVLYGTQVTREGVQHLQRALPNTKIAFSSNDLKSARSESK